MQRYQGYGRTQECDIYHNEAIHVRHFLQPFPNSIYFLIEVIQQCIFIEVTCT